MISVLLLYDRNDSHRANTGSISNMFGFEKKEKKYDKEVKTKTPFRVPSAVTALRGRIDSEYKENFPQLARYNDLVRDAQACYRILDALMGDKGLAEDVIRTRDDLRERLDELEAKIKNNVTEFRDDLEENVDGNMGYLERKSRRNNAKTLFTEFLDSYELFLTTCREGSSGQGAALDSATASIVKALSALHARFIKVYKQDREIQHLWEMANGRISELEQYCRANATGLESKGLRAELNIKRLKKAADKLSGS